MMTELLILIKHSGLTLTILKQIAKNKLLKSLWSSTVKDQKIACQLRHGYLLSQLTGHDGFHQPLLAQCTVLPFGHQVGRLVFLNNRQNVTVVHLVHATHLNITDVIC